MKKLVCILALIVALAPATFAEKFRVTSCIWYIDNWWADLGAYIAGLNQYNTDLASGDLAAQQADTDYMNFLVQDMQYNIDMYDACTKQKFS